MGKYYWDLGTIKLFSELEKGVEEKISYEPNWINLGDIALLEKGLKTDYFSDRDREIYEKIRTDQVFIPSDRKAKQRFVKKASLFFGVNKKWQKITIN